MIEPHVGDTIRMNAEVYDITESGDYRLYFFRAPGTILSIMPATSRFQLSGRSLDRMSPEIISQKTAGQRAYEASHESDESSVTWDRLDQIRKAKWERIADAARRP